MTIADDFESMFGRLDGTTDSLRCFRHSIVMEAVSIKQDVGTIDPGWLITFKDASRARFNNPTAEAFDPDFYSLTWR